MKKSSRKARSATGDDALDSQTIVPSEPLKARLQHPQQDEFAPGNTPSGAVPILQRWGLSEAEFTEIVDSNPSLRGVTIGYIAEWQFHKRFLHHPEIAEVRKDDDHDRKRKGDRTFRYKGHEFIVEVKSLQTNSVEMRGLSWFGKSQVDASDRRKVTFKDGTTLETTCLLRGQFDVLAVNCYAFENEWCFVFAKNADLPKSTWKKYTEYQREALLPTLIPVTWPPQAPFTTDPFELLDDMVRDREAGLLPEVPEVPVLGVEGTDGERI